MKRLTATVFGRTQSVGYRAQVVALADALSLSGYVKNLPDGTVQVVAEGEEAELKKLAKGLAIKNSLIYVTEVQETYSPATGEYEGFIKVVETGETDSRLDKAAELLKQLIVVVKEGVEVSKENLAISKENLAVSKTGFQEVNGKLDEMLEKQDETKTEIVAEIRELRSDLKTGLDERLTRIEDSIDQIRAKARI